jgi:hypothetical protein
MRGDPADQYNKSTCRVFSRIDSTVNRSQAMIEDDTGECA